jgi:hypothetical protein
VEIQVISSQYRTQFLKNGGVNPSFSNAFGIYAVIVRVPLEFTVPPAVVTETVPDVAVTGTVTVI